jgi:hypothetical protein
MREPVREPALVSLALFEAILLIVSAPRTVNARPRIFSRGTVENSRPFRFLRRSQ